MVLALYRPPFHITNTMLQYVSRISEKVGRLSVWQSWEKKPHLRRNNRIRSIHASLSIEANSLSMGQVRDVIAGHLVLGEQKEIQEVKNAYAAYEQLMALNPYSIDELKRLHGIMTRYTVEESGTFRRGEEGVFSGGKCIFMAPPARLVPGLMDDLFGWMKRECNEVHPLILAAIFHYEFVFIHPFADGNGRMARLWHTALLAKWKPLFAYIPIESQIEKFQEDYYQAIARCHAAGTSDIFIEFMLQQIDSILDEFAAQSEKDGEELTEYVRRLLNVMEYGIPYTAQALMERLQLKSKETFRKHYLNPAMKLQLVTMTIPDKPRSRNQRYIRQ